MSQIENIKGPGALCIFSFMGRMIATEPRDPVFNHEKVCYHTHRHKVGSDPVAARSLGASLPWRLCCCYTGPYSLTVWQSQIELSHEKTENHKAWLPVHSVGSWTLQSHLHITSHWQTMDCGNQWYASHWRYKELRRSKGQRLELSQKSMQVMEAVSIIIVGLMTAMWLFIIVGLVCCHVHQLQERKRLRRTHASYFKQ